MNRNALFLLLALLLLPLRTFAAGGIVVDPGKPIYPPFQTTDNIIGQTTVFNLTPASILVAQTDDPTEQAGVAAFNYFFTIQLFVGLCAAWVRMTLSIIKKEVL